MSVFISDLYRLGAAKLFDEAAVHPYAADPERALARTVQLRELLDRAGDAVQADLDHRGRLGIWRAALRAHRRARAPGRVPDEDLRARGRRTRAPRLAGSSGTP